MTKTKHPGEQKEKFILLKTAAKKYGTNEKNVLNWAKTRKITACRIGETWVIDDNSIRNYIDLNKKISDYDIYLKKIVAEKLEDINNTVAEMDDCIYILKSKKKINPYLRPLIEEMAALIPNEEKRSIFIEISNGNYPANLAKEKNIPYDKICYHYNQALRMLAKKTGFLNTYRDTLAALKFKVRELEITNQIQDKELKKLYSILPYPKPTPEKLTPEIVKILSTFLCDFDFDTRALSCFRWFNFETVEDLLRFTKAGGFRQLTCYRSFGKKSLVLLKAVLIENNIIDIDEKSYLYPFV